MVRRWAVVAVAGFVGCESMKNPQPAPVAVQHPLAATAATPEAPRVASLQLTEERPRPATPAAQPPDAPEPADALTLAAEALDRGDKGVAAVHLEAYVRLHPEQLMFRAQLADLLVKVDRPDDARVHYERFAVAARNATGVPKSHLVHVHTRLMEIGQRSGDRFAELYHRGVGLLLLVKDEDGKPDREAEFCEEMLCKAMKALVEAKELNPNETGVRVYLAEVYDRMGNRRAASAERTAASGSVVATGLAPLFRE